MFNKCWKTKLLGEFQPVVVVLIRKVVAVSVILEASLISVPSIRKTEISKASFVSGLVRIPSYLCEVRDEIRTIVFDPKRRSNIF